MYFTIKTNYINTLIPKEYLCDDMKITVTKLEYVHLFYHLGELLVNVILSNEINIDENQTSHQIDKYELGEVYSLYELETYEKFGLGIQDNHHIINFASRDNRLDFLNWYLGSGYIPHYSIGALNSASCNGNIEVLDWWLTCGWELKYDTQIINFASMYGLIDILDWWLNSGLELKYDTNAINLASCYNNIKILDWWLASGLELKYDEKSILAACTSPKNLHKFPINNPIEYNDIQTDIKTLDWWINSGLELKYNELVIDGFSIDGNIDILNWWFQSGLELKYTNEAMDGASKNGHFNILDKWLEMHINHGIELKYSEASMDNVSNGVDVIQLLTWWIKSGLKIKYTRNFIIKILKSGKINVLDFIIKNDLEIKCDDKLLNTLISSCNLLNIFSDNNIGNLNILSLLSGQSMNYPEILDYASCSKILDFWIKNDLPIKYSNMAIDNAFQDNNIDVLNWWLKSGMIIKHSKYSTIIDKNKCNQSTIQWWRDSGLPLEYLEKII
nr:hypothetical protein [Megavirus caiporensis]